MTPPRKAPLIVKEPIFSVVSVTISWSQRKYHGAFAGFGVIIGLAASSRGERDEAGQDAHDGERPEDDDRDPPHEVVDRVDRPVRGLERHGADRRGLAARDAEERVGLRLRGRAPRPSPCVERPAVGLREAAVLADAPHVVREERPEAGRQEDAVEDVEADERRLVDRPPAERSSRICGPTNGTELAMFVPTVTAQ